jgi:hypothetical protein
LYVQVDPISYPVSSLSFCAKGGAVSHIAFHTRLLPHLSRAIPKPLREHVDAAAERMGGRDGLLAIPQGGEGSAAPAEQSMLSSRRASLSG